MSRVRIQIARGASAAPAVSGSSVTAATAATGFTAPPLATAQRKANTQITATEAGTSGFPKIVAAEKYAIDHHLGGVISQSFGATEETFPTTQSLLALRAASIDSYELDIASGVGTVNAAWSGPELARIG